MDRELPLAIQKLQHKFRLEGRQVKQDAYAIRHFGVVEVVDGPQYWISLIPSGMTRLSVPGMFGMMVIASEQLDKLEPLQADGVLPEWARYVIAIRFPR